MVPDAVAHPRFESEECRDRRNECLKKAQGSILAELSLELFTVEINWIAFESLRCVLRKEYRKACMGCSVVRDLVEVFDSQIRNWIKPEFSEPIVDHRHQIVELIPR